MVPWVVLEYEYEVGLCSMMSKEGRGKREGEREETTKRSI